MATKRNVKKDIEYVTYEVLNDCFLSIESHPDRKKDEIMSLIAETLTTRNELVARVNKRDIKKGEAKKYFKQIYNDLMKSADESFTKLSVLIK